MCCFDTSKCKLRPPAAPCHAGTHRSVEMQTPSLGKGAGQAAAGTGRAHKGAPADPQAGKLEKEDQSLQTMNVLVLQMLFSQFRV